MAVCDKCFAELAETAAFCSECGAAVLSAHPDNLQLEGSDREVYQELALANQHRQHRRWSDAEGICIAILRRFPNNATAHSLLGDIFADLRKTDDAVHWYEMALELNPSSVADRKKLEQQKSIKAEEERRKAKEASAQVGPPLSRLTPGPQAWTRIILGLVALMIAVAVFAAGYQMAAARRRQAAGGQAPSITYPSPNASTGVPGMDARQTPPTPGQPDRRVEPTQPAEQQPARAFAMSHDEQTLLNRLSQSVPVLSVMLDPRNAATAVVSFEISTGALTRDRILHEALQTAQAVFRERQILLTLTVRAMTPRPGAGLDPLFVGDCARELALPVQKPNQGEIMPNPAQVFTNIYWAGGVN